MMNRLLFALILLPLVARADDIMLWKANNETSATLVPSYAGQSSPFPKVAKVEDVSSSINAEAEAARLARLQALERAEKLLSGKAAFKPELGLIRVDGRVEGAAGPKILISNQWIGLGREIQVRLSRTPEASAAIDELRKYDSDSASELDAKLDQRLQQAPYLNLTVDAIEPTEIQLHSSYGKHTIPISKAQDD